jgi:hypothetical protein|tara:strand:+ start:34090 stop:34407 length:318 start_codon:yes stop_codon:yes gene_type:complete
MTKQIKTFEDFFAARDFAAENVKGHPSWRVEQTDAGFVIELSPGHFMTDDPDRMATFILHTKSCVQDDVAPLSWETFKRIFAPDPANGLLEANCLAHKLAEKGAA